MKSEKEKMLAGEPYIANDPQLIEEQARVRELIFQFNQSSPRHQASRLQLLKQILGSVADDNINIQPPFNCDYGYNIHVGKNFFANFNCVILDVCRVSIGDNCLLAPGVQIYTATYPLDAATRAGGQELGRPVSIGHNVWIGGLAVINPGVSIGDNAIVAAGAIVVKDVPANTVVAGNPARALKSLL